MFGVLGEGKIARFGRFYKEVGGANLLGGCLTGGAIWGSI